MTCGVTGFDLYESNNCTGPSFNMNATCQPPPGGWTTNSYSYKAVVTRSASATACEVTSNSVAGGSVAPTGALTVCCLP
jgi:hypothetical protein